MQGPELRLIEAADRLVATLTAERDHLREEIAQLVAQRDRAERAAIHWRSEARRLRAEMAMLQRKSDTRRRAAMPTEYDVVSAPSYLFEPASDATPQQMRDQILALLPVAREYVMLCATNRVLPGPATEKMDGVAIDWDAVRMHQRFSDVQPAIIAEGP